MYPATIKRIEQPVWRHPLGGKRLFANAENPTGRRWSGYRRSMWSGRKVCACPQFFISEPLDEQSCTVSSKLKVNMVVVPGCPTALKADLCIRYAKFLDEMRLNKDFSHTNIRR